MAAALAVGLAIVAALFFATSSTLVRARVRSAGPLVALALSLAVNVAVLWAIAFAFFDVTVDLWRWRYFVAAGALAPVLGRFFNYAGIDALGVNISSPITFANPVVSMAVAIAFLGERISVLGLAGGLIVVAGGSVIASAKGDGTVDFEKKYLVLPVLAAAFYGTSHVFRKLGIDLVSSPVVAAAVTASTSLVLLTGYFVVRPEKRTVDVGRDEALFFVLAGLATSIAIPVFYLALQVGSVVIVTPLLNTTPLFILAFSYLFFRGGELFTPRVTGGTVAVVVGVTLLSVYGSV